MDNIKKYYTNLKDGQKISYKLFNRPYKDGIVKIINGVKTIGGVDVRSLPIFDIRFYHPELKKGEIFLGNVSKTRHIRPCYKKIKSYRRGNKAYDIYGNDMSDENDLVPEFIHKSEEHLLPKTIADFSKPI